METNVTVINTDHGRGNKQDQQERNSKTIKHQIFKAIQK